MPENEAPGSFKGAMPGTKQAYSYIIATIQLKSIPFLKGGLSWIKLY
jgi:hypothetical protein